MNEEDWEEREAEFAEFRRCVALMARLVRAVEASEAGRHKPEHPELDWCQAIVTKTGRRCHHNVAADGLCTMHWRRRAAGEQVRTVAPPERPSF